MTFGVESGEDTGVDMPNLTPLLLLTIFVLFVSWVRSFLRHYQVHRLSNCVPWFQIEIVQFFHAEKRERERERERRKEVMQFNILCLYVHDMSSRETPDNKSYITTTEILYTKNPYLSKLSVAFFLNVCKVKVIIIG